MELELLAAPDSVTTLSGLKTLGREGRVRTGALKIVWHDSPDHALLQQGQTLAERQGVWALERILPGHETWLPGQPSPVLDQAERPEDLRINLPEPLAPVAAFEGRRALSVHRIGEASVTLCIDRGRLRAVAADQPLAWLTITGEDQPVHAMARMIAEAVEVQVPRASLAAQGIALATGGVPAPRHLGQPLLPHQDMTLTDALAHILGHLTDVILHFAPAAAAPVTAANDPPDTARIEAVHQMRVAVRRAKSAVSIFRPALPEGTLDPVQNGLKDLGERLARTRDWDVFVSETAVMITEMLPENEKLERMIAAAVRRRRDYRANLADYLTSAAFRTLAIDLVCFAASAHWHPPDSTIDLPTAEAETPVAGPRLVRDFAPGVLQHRWKKLIASAKRIEALDIPELHAVRLRAKRARYAAEMFLDPQDGKAAPRFIRRLSVLQQRLGELNDGAVAAHLMSELGGPSGRHAYAVGIVAGFTAARADKMRPRIIQAFERFRRQSAYWA